MIKISIWQDYLEHFLIYLHLKYFGEVQKFRKYNFRDKGCLTAIDGNWHTCLQDSFGGKCVYV